MSDDPGQEYLADGIFELGEYAKHVEEGLAGGGARTDRLLSRAQSNASLPQLMDDVLQIPQ
jgi:hypothetical protein